MGACNGKPDTRGEENGDTRQKSGDRKQLYKFPSIPEDEEAKSGAGGESAGEKPTKPVIEKQRSAEQQVKENIQRKALSKKLRVGRNVQGEAFVIEDVIDGFKPKVIPKDAADAAAIRASLHGHFLFSNLTSRQLGVVVDAMELEKIPQGETLIEEGTEGKKFYVVKDGEFDVIVNTFHDGVFDISVGKTVKTLGPKQNFGELALMYDCPRTATIQAKTDAEVWALDRQTFKTCVLVLGEKKNRNQIDTLKAVEVFRNLGTDVLDTISRAMLPQAFAAGKPVITQGEEGSVFYIVESGELECSIDGKFIRTMKTGDFFGERALLTNEPRSATITAKSDVEVLAMEREDFETLLGPLASLSEHMEKVHSDRLRDNENAAVAQAADKTKEEEAAHAEIRRKSFRAIPITDLVIIKDVGRGAFGRVKVVRHKETKELYALKVMQKHVIVRTKNALQVLREKKLLNLVQPHPLIVRLVSSMQDKNCLYLLQEFINGGDLFHRLYNIEGVFPAATAQYYGACVVLMLEKLHSMSILYRDLKPENLLLNAKGVLKMVDFGMAKKVTGRTYTLCGTPEYMAPEVIHSVGHGKGVDYWALGVLIFEMICGDSPFEDPNNNHLNVYKNIELGRLNFPNWLDDRAGIDLVRRLLIKSQTKRLGCLKGGADDVKRHPWFKDLSFEGIMDGTAQPPIVPSMKDDLDISNFYPIDSDNRIISYTRTGKPYEKEWEKEF